MDNEQAKLILQAYRPGGEDASDPFFAEALEQARRDPELGNWLAAQRRFDESMRRALKSVQPPDSLRDSLLLLPKVSSFPTETRRRFWPTPAILALAAALIVLCTVSFLWLPQSAHDKTAATTVRDVTTEVLALKANNKISLGKMSSDPAEIHAWLTARGAPGNFELPTGLRQIPALGCQSYTIGGAKVSLVCFMLGKDQVIHLFVVDNAELKDAPADLRVAVQTKHGHTWAVWTSGDKTFILTGVNVSEEMLRGLI
ncbi:MAG: hypothetical protein Fur0032_15860 [Terrimicrobiaceae bacterium]